VPVPNQSAICVGSVVGFLNVFSYTLPAPPPCRLDIIFDLKAALFYFYYRLREKILIDFMIFPFLKKTVDMLYLTPNLGKSEVRLLIVRRIIKAYI
jgi:hypothetical protein